MRINLLPFVLAILFLGSAACSDDDPVVTGGSVSIGGQTYKTIQIGDQEWTAINYAGPGGQPYDAGNTLPDYGKYYAMAELDGISLPAGWRIPTQQDYEKLALHYSVTLPSHGTQTDAIKSLTSKTNWNHVNGTNASGFNALPAGYIFGEASPIGGDIAEFWTSEGVTLSIQEAGVGLKSLRMLFYQSDNSPDYKFNVRFVRD